VGSFCANGLVFRLRPNGSGDRPLMGVFRGDCDGGTDRHANPTAAPPIWGSKLSRRALWCAGDAINERERQVTIRVGVDGFGRIGRNFYRAQVISYEIAMALSFAAVAQPAERQPSSR
jgi:hypothetical protein